MTPQILRLERYALEKGLSILPEGIPPNRLLTRTLMKWNRESMLRAKLTYDTSFPHDNTTRKRKHRSLQREKYTLGRTMMRAFREGNGYLLLSEVSGPNKKKDTSTSAYFLIFSFRFSLLPP